MKHVFSLIFIAFAITVNAQQKAKIEVSYTEYQPNMRTGEKNGTTHQYILLASGDDSKFFVSVRNVPTFGVLGLLLNL